jgi:DNA-binding MurR/RpiR family transcriptional regulator
MTKHTPLSRDEIEAIRARIITETASQLAECFEVHPATIRKWTTGLDRAKRRYAKRAVNDRTLLSMVSRLTQAEVARQLGVSPAAVCIRLKRIRTSGARRYDQHIAQDRGGTWAQTVG